jgi:hypothetical protein
MSAHALLEDLRTRDVSLKVDGLTLRVDAPTGILNEEDRKTLRENKRALIRHLERERLKLEKADQRGLVIKWSREPGYISLHDPTTGEWHEVKASECPPSIVESAKAQHRRSRERASAATAR